MAWNDDREPTTTPPRPEDADDVVGAAEQAVYDATCTCDDTYGDNPWCPACFPHMACPRCCKLRERHPEATDRQVVHIHEMWHTGRPFVPAGNRRFA